MKLCKLALILVAIQISMNIDAIKNSQSRSLQKKETVRHVNKKEDRPNQFNEIIEEAKFEIKRVYEKSLSKIRSAADNIRAEIRREGKLDLNVEDLLRHASEETRERLLRALNAANKSLDRGRVKTQSLVHQAIAEAKREASREKKEREKRTK